MLAMGGPLLGSLVGVGSPPASEGGHGIDKAPVVLDAPLGTASLLLLFRFSHAGDL